MNTVIYARGRPLACTLRPLTVQNSNYRKGRRTVVLARIRGQRLTSDRSPWEQLLSGHSTGCFGKSPKTSATGTPPSDLVQRSPFRVCRYQEPRPKDGVRRKEITDYEVRAGKSRSGLEFRFK